MTAVVSVALRKPVLVWASAFLMAEWVVKNVLFVGDAYGSLPNILTSVGIAFVEYAAWYWSKERIYAAFTLQSIPVIVWHSIQSAAGMNPYYYVLVLNLLFASQVLIVWIFAFASFAREERRTSSE